MAFTPIHNSTLSPVTTLVPDNNSPLTELDPITQAIAQAHKQLLIVIEVQQWKRTCSRGWKSAGRVRWQSDAKNGFSDMTKVQIGWDQ